jgi:hypothetical protein
MRALEQWQRLIRPTLSYQDVGPVVVRVGRASGVTDATQRLGSTGEHGERIGPAALDRWLHGQVVQCVRLPSKVAKLLEDA